MSYFTPEGLDQLAGFESTNNPTVVNSSGHAGLYQFSGSLWQTYAPQAGVDIGVYPTADTAPADLQTEVAGITPASNWLCPGCDAPITAAVAANPSLLSDTPGGSVTDPATGASLAFVPDSASSAPSLGGSLQDPSFSDPLYVPGTGAVASYGAADPLGLGAAAQNALTGDPVTGAPADTTPSTSVLPALGANITDWLTRGGLVLLGIVLVGAAAWALASGEGRQLVQKVAA